MVKKLLSNGAFLNLFTRQLSVYDLQYATNARHMENTARCCENSFWRIYNHARVSPKTLSLHRYFSGAKTITLGLTIKK
jgi:hypothetical protein